MKLFPTLIAINKHFLQDLKNSCKEFYFANDFLKPNHKCTQTHTKETGKEIVLRNPCKINWNLIKSSAGDVGWKREKELQSFNILQSC